MRKIMIAVLLLAMTGCSFNSQSFNKVLNSIPIACIEMKYNLNSSPKWELEACLNSGLCFSTGADSESELWKYFNMQVKQVEKDIKAREKLR